MTAEPMIEWRCAQRCWVLRVHLDAEGWHLTGRPRRLHPAIYMTETGLAEQGYTLEAWGRGEIALPNVRKSRAFIKSIPLDPALWPTGVLLPIGCKHGAGTAPLAWLAEDAVLARDTASSSWPVRRSVAVT